MNKRPPEPLEPVTLEELDREFQGMVHVEGWRIGCCFVYVSRDKYEYTLRTPKTNRIYKVPLFKRLLHTRKRTLSLQYAREQAAKMERGTN